MRTNQQLWAAWKDGLLTRLGEAQEHALSHDLEPVEQVHTLRKHTKALRSLLRLAPGRTSAPAYREERRLRRLARRFAPMRDAAALRDALEALGERNFITQPPNEPALRPGSLARAARHFERCAIEVKGWHLEPADFTEALVRSYRRARRRCPDDFTQASADTLHRLRRASICLGHQLKLVSSARTLTRHLERLRRALGHHHDLELLRVWVRTSSPGSKKVLLKAITTTQAHHARAAARHADHAFSLPPKELRRRLRELTTAAAS